MSVICFEGGNFVCGIDVKYLTTDLSFSLDASKATPIIESQQSSRENFCDLIHPKL